MFKNISKNSKMIRTLVLALTFIASWYAGIFFDNYGLFDEINSGKIITKHISPSHMTLGFQAFLVSEHLMMINTPRKVPEKYFLTLSVGSAKVEVTKERYKKCEVGVEFPSDC